MWPTKLFVTNPSLLDAILPPQEWHYPESSVQTFRWYGWAVSSQQSFSVLWLLSGNPSLRAHF